MHLVVYGPAKLYYEVEHRDEMSEYKTTAAHNIIYTERPAVFN